MTAFVQRKRQRKDLGKMLKSKVLRIGSRAQRAAEEAKIPADAKTISQSAGVGLISFLFGAGKIFGAVSPFSTALTSGLPLRWAFVSAVGGVASAIAFGRPGFTLYRISCVLLALAARLLLARFVKGRPKPIVYCLTGFGASALCTLFFGMVRSLSAADFALLLIEVFLTACLSYFFSLAGNALSRRQGAVWSYAELTSFCVAGVSAVVSLAAFELFHVNLGTIAGVVAVLAAMSRFGVTGSSAAAILAAIALCLHSADMMEFSGILIIAGFLAGAFSPLKKFGQIAVFLAVTVFSLFLLGAPVFLTYRLIDCFFAAAIFVLLPQRWLDRIKPRDGSAPAALNPRFMQGSVAARLSFASDTIRDLEEELSKVSARFGEIDYNNLSSIYETAANTVCKGCSRMLLCWDDNYSDTLNAFHPLSDTLRAAGEVTKATLPGYFQEKCCKTDRLCAAVNEYYRSFVAKQNQKRQIAEARRIVFEQFQAIAGMLSEVSEEVGLVTGYDESLTRAAETAYRRLEKEPERVVCAVDKYGRSSIEVYTSELLKTSPSALSEALSAATGRDFDLPSVSHVRERTKLSFFERACYSLDFSGEQCCMGDNVVCGDSWEYFSDSRGCAYLLLSDGMGNGKRAAIDSVMTCSILSKLIQAGFGLEAAVGLLNSSLSVKSTDESMATIDMLKFDLYTGKAECCKAGAAVTFLWQRGEIKRLASGSLPVGILQGAKVKKQPLTLKEGDAVLLVSDGALSAGEGWIAEELRRNADKPAKEIAAQICGQARERCRELHPDDITVIAVKVEKG